VKEGLLRAQHSIFGTGSYLHAVYIIENPLVLWTPPFSVGVVPSAWVFLGTGFPAVTLWLGPQASSLHPLFTSIPHPHLSSLIILLLGLGFTTLSNLTDWTSQPPYKVMSGIDLPFWPDRPMTVLWDRLLRDRGRDLTSNTPGGGLTSC